MTTDPLSTWILSKLQIQNYLTILKILFEDQEALKASGRASRAI